MEREEIKETLVGILVDLHPSIKRKEVNDETNFYLDLSLDSIDLVEICMEVEKEFAIEITDAEAERIITFGDLIDFVEPKINN